jgi:Na+/melibiose symporter-like transporter
MIITRQKDVPWIWAAFAHLPWAAMLFASAASTIVFTLEIRKFTANPAAIATLLTFTGFLTMFTAPLANWVSDRVWSKWGRRKVFYVPAVFAQGVLILFVPFAPDLMWLAIIYFFQFVAASFKSPNESLNQEVVPNHQRGRAAVLNKCYVQFGLMAYNLALIGRFDDVYPNAPISNFLTNITGEKLMFVVFSLALLSVVLLVSLGFKEIRPNKLKLMKEDLGGKVTAWRITKQLFIDVFKAEWWPLYLLAISQAMYGVKLGGMVALMYTDQWEYSAQVLGTTQGVAQLVSIIFVLLVFPLADKFDKLKFYLVAITLGLIGKLLWYAYVMLVVPDNRPSIMEIILIGEAINMLGQLAGIISYPLVYEFIPLNKLGTASAGLGLFRGFLGMVIGPMVGIWLLYYSNIFMPGAGSNVVVVMEQPVDEAYMEGLKEEWEIETGQRIWVNMYKPFGVKLDESRQWEVRIRDEDAEQLQNKIALAEAELTDIQRDIDSFNIRGETVGRAPLDHKAETTFELSQLRQQQTALSEGFRAYLYERLGDQLASLEEGFRSIEVSGNTVTIEAETALAVEQQQAENMREELALKLGIDEAQVRFERSGSNDEFVTIAATFPEDYQLDIEAEPEISEYVEALLAGGGTSEAMVSNAIDLATAAEEVTEGIRNSILMPFPDTNYKPQKVDYFSSYLLMAITDVFAIMIAIYLIRAEKAGKIQRRGKIEDEASGGHEHVDDKHVHASEEAIEHYVTPPSTDPDVQTHPDGTQTYTPGMKGIKFVCMMLGVAIFCFGVFWQWDNFRLFLFGDTTQATVTSILQEKPGQEPVILDTRKAVNEAEDPTRNAIYSYRIRFSDESGTERETGLNYGQVLRPLLSIGDTVTISYDTAEPETVIERYHVRTWAYGFFFMGIGLLMAIPQFFIWRAANKPIVLDQIGDYEDIKKYNEDRDNAKANRAKANVEPAPGADTPRS